jgi:hypothetical protein
VMFGRLQRDPRKWSQALAMRAFAIPDIDEDGMGVWRLYFQEYDPKDAVASRSTSIRFMLRLG